MRTLVTGSQMKAIDAYTIHTVGIPSLVLMERAALAVAEEAKRYAEKTDIIWAVCGTGNNGADGIAAARMLHLEGFHTCVLLVGDESRGSEENRHQLSIARKAGVMVCDWKEKRGKSCDVILDAVFGVGLSREVGGEHKECLSWLAGMKERRKQKGKKETVCVAVDIPSGIHSDKGTVMGIALKADVTVTFGWEKMGTALYPGREYAGKVCIASIGFFPDAPETVKEEKNGSWERAFTYEAEDLSRIPKRKAYSNKGSFGKVLIVAGSHNMSGAAYLSALSAYRSGAGLVKVLTVESNRSVLQTLLPEAIFSCYTPEELLGDREAFKARIEEEMNWADVVVLGPGLGKEPYVEYLAEEILTSAFVPVIIDADGLNTIAAHPYLTAYYTENIIITPHLGEMARLTGMKISEIQEDLAETAAEYASRYGITCVLKDAATVVAGKDGELFVNSSGTSAMAKAGSGDVLTGAVAGLLAIGMDLFDAACMGVYLHGLAGEKVSEKGMHSLLATELADALGSVMGQ